MALRSGDTWIETDRLRLRRYEAGHFTALAELTALPETFQYSERGPMSSEEAWSRLLRHIGHWAVMGFGFFAIEEKIGGRFVGEAGLNDFQRGLGPDFDGVPEIGWTITPSAQKRGYATEAAEAVLAWMEERFDSARVVCLIHLANAASLRVAEKLGFVQQGECIYRGYPAVRLERWRSPAEPRVQPPN
jgi:RimJ/RimL family protein N-acetyltransferase